MSDIKDKPMLGLDQIADQRNEILKRSGIFILVFTIIFFIFAVTLIIHLNSIVTITQELYKTELNEIAKTEREVEYHQIADKDIEIIELATGNTYYPDMIHIKNRIVYARLIDINLRQTKWLVYDITTISIKINKVGILEDNLI